MESVNVVTLNANEQPSPIITMIAWYSWVMFAVYLAVSHCILLYSIIFRIYVSRSVNFRVPECWFYVPELGLGESLLIVAFSSNERLTPFGY